MRAGYHPTHERGPEKTASKNDLKKQGFYHTPAWRKLRVLALQRDHYLCQECLRKKRIVKATEVHHIKPITDFPELALSLDNLECLCWSCHEETKSHGSASTVPSGVRILRIRDGTEENIK